MTPRPGERVAEVVVFPAAPPRQYASVVGAVCYSQNSLPYRAGVIVELAVTQWGGPVLGMECGTDWIRVS